MSRTIPRRLLAQSPLTPTADLLPLFRISSQCVRPFSQTPNKRADEDSIGGPSTPPPSEPADGPKISWLKPPSRSAASQPRAQSGGIQSLTSRFGKLMDAQREARTAKTAPDEYEPLVPNSLAKFEEPHHLHIYATRHNCHITITRPNRTPIISVSCGNIGFRKAARKTYDAAFQLAAYAMGRITDHREFVDIKKLEVTLRGFGQGREAVTKALLGSEGRFLRGKVIRVQDATRLKFGGTRSPKPRRLG